MLAEEEKSPSARILPVWLLFGFASLLFYFTRVDFYHTGFGINGWPLIVYQLMRTAYIFFLFWLIYFPGYVLLRRFNVDELSPLPRVIACFFTGAGLWHALLFVMGLAGLYRYPLMAGLALVVMAFSLPHARQCASRLHTVQITSGFGWNAGAFILFLIFRGLYPGGGHDYFQHYFYYYQQVVETGTLGPHSVWYQFFYSRGAGLYFLSMILTDPLAPQLVTTCFMLVANLIIYAWLRELCSARVANAAGTLYWLGLIYTPGYVFSGWAHLEKLHEIMAVLVLAVMWFCWRVCTGLNRVENQGFYWCCIAAVLVQTISAAIIGPVVAIMFLYRRNAALLIAGLITGLTVLVLLWINYFYTGIIFDQKIVPLWKFIDWPKLYRLNAVFEVLLVRMEHERMLGDFVPLAQMPWKILQCLRLDLWGSFVVLGLLLRVRQKPFLQGDKEKIFVVYMCALIAVVTAIAVLFGRFNWVSFYRLTSFCYAPALLLALWLPPWGRLMFLQTYAVAVRNVGIVVLLIFVLWAPKEMQMLERLWRGPLALASGHYSLRDSYRDQDHFLTGMFAGAAISNGVEEARKAIGPNVRLRTLSDPIYCMAPGCNLESMVSFTIGANAQHLLLALPAEAKRILQDAGLNYFFASPEAYVNDVLALSPLFAPEHIADWLGVVWTDGEHYVLTWHNPATKPLPPEFIDKYRQKVQESKFLGAFPLQRYQELLESLPEVN